MKSYKISENLKAGFEFENKDKIKRANFEQDMDPARNPSVVRSIVINAPR